VDLIKRVGFSEAKAGGSACHEDIVRPMTGVKGDSSLEGRGDGG
jgi:hypothetical protein